MRASGIFKIKNKSPMNPKHPVPRGTRPKPTATKPSVTRGLKLLKELHQTKRQLHALIVLENARRLKRYLLTQKRIQILENEEPKPLRLSDRIRIIDIIPPKRYLNLVREQQDRADAEHFEKLKQPLRRKRNALERKCNRYLKRIRRLSESTTQV